MSCSSCKYLNTDKKSNGAVSGSCYYCSKRKCYVNGSNNSCYEFENNYGRESYECNKIYEEGEHYCNDTTPISSYLTLLVFLIIIVIIANIF